MVLTDLAFALPGEYHSAAGLGAYCALSTREYK